MTYQMTEIIQAYLRYETVSQVTIRQSERVPFPAVTVCSANTLRMSLVREWIRHCEEEEEEYARFLCQHFANELHQIDDQYDRINGSLLTKILQSLTIPELMSKNDELLKRKLGDAFDQRSTEDLLHQWQLTAVSRQNLAWNLSWNLTRYHPKLARKLSDSVFDLLDDDGSFNGKKYDAKTTESQWKYHFHLATTVAPGGGNCYTFNMDGALYQTSPNMEGGLRVNLAKNKSRWMEDCFESFPVQNADGFCGKYQIMVHAPGTLPTLAYGEVWTIGESTALLYEFEERQNLKHPHGDCDTKHPPEMLAQYAGIRWYNYSIKTCIAFKYFNNLPISPSLSHVYSDNPKNVTCHAECHQRLFQISRGVEEYPNDFRLDVFNKNLEIKSVIQMPAVTFEQVVANAGGLAGLWLGASMLSVMELMEFVVNLLHLAFGWIWAKLVIQPMSNT